MMHINASLNEGRSNFFDGHGATCPFLVLNNAVAALNPISTETTDNINIRRVVLEERGDERKHRRPVLGRII